LRGLLTWELTGKEMMISDFTNTNFLSPSCFHPARTELVAPGNGTCQPAPACPFAFTSHPFSRNLIQHTYHNVLSDVKRFSDFFLIYYFVVSSDSSLENTSQDLQIFIFSFQLPCTVPSQTVPFINQQRSPALNSQAGHCFFWSGEHFFIIQHGLRRLRFSPNLERRKNICRSTEAGTDRHACS